MRIVTCEHAANKVPAAYRDLFKSKKAILSTHEAYDIGAAELARALAKQLHAPFFLYTNTRLLIDANRSIGHPRLFSRFTKLLDKSQKNRLLERCYKAYRGPIENMIKSAVRRNNKVLHISAHSFTPVLSGKRRSADIGLLYDPSRKEECAFCNTLKKKIRAADKGFRIRCNYPYQGRSDSMVSFTRKQLPAVSYIGIELEINQKILGDLKRWQSLKVILQRVFFETAELYDL